LSGAVRTNSFTVVRIEIPRTASGFAIVHQDVVAFS